NVAVVLSESGGDFATGAVSLSGAAGPTPGPALFPYTTLFRSVSGMTGDGTVIATVGAAKAHDTAGNANAASTSSDNTVTYDTTIEVTSNTLTYPQHDTTQTNTSASSTTDQDSNTVTVTATDGT